MATMNVNVDEKEKVSELNIETKIKLTKEFRPLNELLSKNISK